ncbi:MAG: PIG-L family deacetylase [Opitutales bacterium]
MARIISAILFASSMAAYANVSPKTVGEIQHGIQKLGTLASVLYVAAHPDDENTRLIAYMANEAKAETTYLSLTRGDGGQNLLGDDLGHKLGVARTHELLEARKIDGGKQFFSRANDFGYSKSAVESIEIWGKDQVMADTVWAIRVLRPDIIINRFSTEPGFTHGHHTASAQLAVEAFELAADPEQFPEQLKWVEPWQAKRIVWNTSTWFYRRRGLDFDPRSMVSVDTGVYNPTLGMAYSEIAALSRSAHKTQGFGATPRLGESKEYFEHIRGPQAESDLFDGVDTSWTRLEGGEGVGKMVAKLQSSFDSTRPEASVGELLSIYRAIGELPDGFWKEKKMAEVRDLIFACIGLDVEWLSSEKEGTPGSQVRGEVLAVQRSSFDVKIQGSSTGDAKSMRKNVLVKLPLPVTVSEDAPVSQPYWLRKPGTLGAYVVDDQEWIGMPEGLSPLATPVTVTVAGEALTIILEPEFKYNDPVDGEVKERFQITPPATLNLDERLHIVSSPEPISVGATLQVREDTAQGALEFKANDGWTVSPERVEFEGKQGEEIRIETEWVPSGEPGQSSLLGSVLLDGETIDVGYERMEYDHIPVQTFFPKAEAKGILLDVEKRGERIGYIEGAGDAVPQALERIGYQVDMLTEADLSSDVLEQYDAVVLGIRALNTIDRIGFMMPTLFDYAKAGGVLILQYNTGHRLKTTDYSPFRLNISRDRVTDEFAAVEILEPEHRVLNYPNKIGAADFENWVQERGLYFPNAWGKEFTPIFSIADPDESPSEGSLLIAKYGKGFYVYSGLSWFRQLPAGVPGAYRIFANIVSLGKAVNE